MSRNARTAIGIVAVAAGVSLAARPGAQDNEKPAGTGQPSPAEAAAMQEWAKIAAPNKHHKHLDYFVGKWKTRTKVWMGGPGSQAVESEGVSEVNWVAGGRFLFERHNGTFVGQPYEGMGLTGYDNFRNMYVRTWVSNMGTEILTMRGARHPETGAFTYYGAMDEPMMKVVGRTVKYVVRVKDENHYLFELTDLHAGDDYKVVEVLYTRQ